MRPHGALRGDKIQRADLQRRGIDHAGIVGRVKQRQRKDQRPGPRPQQGDHQQRQQERRQAQDHLGGADGHKLYHAAEIAAEQAQRGAQHGGGQRRSHRDEQRGAPAPDQPRQHVAAKFVLPQPVLCRGAGKAPRHIHHPDIGQGQHRGQQHHRHQKPHEDPRQDQLAISSPSTVSTGISALRTTWRRRIGPRDRPLARAVRT